VTSPEAYRQYGRELDNLLQPQSYPVAIKLLTEEKEIPQGAIRPKKDQGVHYSLCQAIAKARFGGETVAMLTEDHWCWAPLVSFGLVEFHENHESFQLIAKYLGIADEEATKDFLRRFPRLEYGKYTGLVVAPLIKAEFVPDLVLLYVNHAQLRDILMSVKFKTGELVTSQFDAIDSCVYSTIPVIKNGEYRITFPDPGEVERALAKDEEVIFSAPAQRLEELLAGLSVFGGGKMRFAEPATEIEPDHPRPEFYRQLFRAWHLDVEE